MTLLANIFSFSTTFSRMFSRTHKSGYLRATSKKKKPRNHCGFKTFNGAAGQIRTADLILTKDALYLLSYSSKWRPRRDSNPRPPAWQAGVLTNWTTWPYTHGVESLRLNKLIIALTTSVVKSFFWQGQKDSNSRHAVLETAALPAELYPYVVGLRGLEPGTGRLWAVCSNQLS